MENLVSMNKTFWKGKKVFITGHTGFKGSWTVIWLKKLGAIVKGYSLEPNTNPSLFVEANIADNIESEIGDMRWVNYEECSKLIRFYNSEKLDILERVHKLLNKYNYLI